MTRPDIAIPVDVTNPGQFFACCGVLELADRLWPGAEGWFEYNRFCIGGTRGGSLESLLESFLQSSVQSTMTAEQQRRLEELRSIGKKDRTAQSEIESEKKALESLRRELPVIIAGDVLLRIDWFCDGLSGGSRFKTWAGQQSVLDIATNMHSGMRAADARSNLTLWNPARSVGLPFHFDSDIGGQGSARDIGFSFDPLAGSEATRIRGTCKPALEILCFVGLQRFRPRELKGGKRFVYTAWQTPSSPSVASALACQSVRYAAAPAYEFRLLYRTKYLKSFLPATRFQGEDDE